MARQSMTWPKAWPKAKWFLSLEHIVSEAWQNVENHDQSIEDLTKVRHEESKNPCQKQDLRHEHEIIFWILKQPWSNFWRTYGSFAKLGMFTIFEAFWPLCKSVKIRESPLISGSSIGRITIKRTPRRTAIMIMGNGIFITESTIKNWLKHWRSSRGEKLYGITMVSHP